MMELISKNIAIVGLGYVGLPLAVEFGKKYNVIGFDIDESRIDDLRNGIDKTKETVKSEIESSKFLKFSCNISDLANANIFIVTVPTPINQFKSPDLGPLLNASNMLGEILKKGDIVIYESTVYPGCTEEECVPVLEKSSGLIFN
jgi:UDP-N-acetyl-D-galactosamine dehydrogenase